MALPRFPICELSNNIGRSVEVIATVIRTGLHKCEGGTVHRGLRISDWSGAWTVIIPEKFVDATIEVGRPVHIQGWVHRNGENVLLKGYSLRAAPLENICNVAAILPRELCPPVAVAALTELVRTIEAMPEAPRGFMNSVLFDPQIGVPLLSAKWGRMCWEDMPGGLLLTIVEGLAHCRGRAEHSLGLKNSSYWLAIAAYLVRDLGRMRYLKAFTEYGQPRLRPELCTLQMMESHLRHLERQSPEAADEIEYALQFMATPAPQRGAHEYPSATVALHPDRSVPRTPDRPLNTYFKGDFLPKSGPYLPRFPRLAA